MVSSPCTIVNRLGLHARAAAQIVKTANRFISDIRINCGDREANGKSIMGILTLAALPGTEIIIIADGPDETDALKALQGLVWSKFGEE